MVAAGDVAEWHVGGSDKKLPETESHKWPLGREVMLWGGTDVEQSWCTESTSSPTEWGRSITQSVAGQQSFELEVQNELC